MKILDALSVRKKLFLLPLLFVAGILATQIWSVYQEGLVRRNVVFKEYEKQLLESHKRTLKTAVEAEVATLAVRIKPLKTREEQVAAIIAETDPIRFFEDRSGYFFSYELSGVRINVPINKSQNAQNLIGVTDKKGIRYVEELIKASKAGGGFVEYYFEKEGKGIQPKLGYALQIPGTDFMVGTGVYIDNIQSETAALETKLQAKYSESRTWTFILVALMVLATLGAAALISRSINQSINRVLNEVELNSKRVAAAAKQVAAASHSLARDSGEQAASLEETSASLEEISSMCKSSSEAARKAKELANQSHGSAELGIKGMDSINTSLREFSSSSDEMRQAMDSVKASNNEVAKIIKTIDEIAFQTNILALNAAVEAARAGEAGMGFAVVADEVRNLAQKSANAARETAEKIEGAIQRTDLGVQTSEKVVGCLTAISGQIKNMEGSLTGMVGKAQQVEQLITEISAASEEQNQGIDQINKAVSQMDKLTQANAASAEESASVSEQLKSEAALLMDEVAQLRLLTGSKHEQAALPPEKKRQIGTPKPAIPAKPKARAMESAHAGVIRGRDLVKTDDVHSIKDQPAESDFENFR